MHAVRLHFANPACRIWITMSVPNTLDMYIFTMYKALHTLVSRPYLFSCLSSTVYFLKILLYFYKDIFFCFFPPTTLMYSLIEGFNISTTLYIVSVHILRTALWRASSRLRCLQWTYTFANATSVTLLGVTNIFTFNFNFSTLKILSHQIFKSFLSSIILNQYFLCGR
jgi:hypothetical protein